MPNDLAMKHLESEKRCASTIRITVTNVSAMNRAIAWGLVRKSKAAHNPATIGFLKLFDNIDLNAKKNENKNKRKNRLSGII
jgi:hypothetical protein